MKQHITVEQLNELTKKATDKLFKWWTPKKGDLVYNCIVGEFVNIEEIMKKDNVNYLNLPLLSIGQMIKFLVDNQSIQGMRGDEYGYLVMPVQVDEVEKLCDALWKEVKEILKK